MTWWKNRFAIGSFKGNGRAGLLTRDRIAASLASTDPNSLFIDPLLDEGQLGDVTVDLRLGYDFLVSIVTRSPYMSLSSEDHEHPRGLGTYFQETRRDLGDRFVLYPNQVVLTTTLEFLALPTNVYADILSRSSFTRLGIHINTMVQPGYRGCVPLELFNHGNNAIELVVGGRICQARFTALRMKGDAYLHAGVSRKYLGEVRPVASRAAEDADLAVLERARKQHPTP